jgi:L-ascorbate metabolism protein UlaG (beta-lactamase superfamily)
LYTRALPDAGASVRLRSLGASGFALDGLGCTLVLDPYLSRLRPWALLRPPQADIGALHRAVPTVDFVLASQAHPGPLADAVALCLQSSAALVGSAAVLSAARVAGLPEASCVLAEEPVACGPAVVRALPAEPPTPSWGPAAWLWRPGTGASQSGAVTAWQVELGGVRVLHLGATRLVPEKLDAVQADVICVGLAGLPSLDSLREAIRLTGAHTVVPCRWQLPMGSALGPQRLLPGVDLPAAAAAVRAMGAQWVLLPNQGVVGLSPGG